MRTFGLANYEDYILQAVVSSTFAKNGLMTATTYALTAIVRFHLSMVICSIATGNWFWDWIFPVGVSVALSFASGNLYRYIETHKSQYEWWVDYIIANYSWDAFKVWKRYALVVGFIYVSLGLSMVTIDNRFLWITTIQTATAFILCDLLEHRNNIVRKWTTWAYAPRLDSVPSRAPLVLSQTEPTIRRRPVSSDVKLWTPNTLDIRLPLDLVVTRDEVDTMAVPLKPITPPREAERLPIHPRPRTPPFVAHTNLDLQSSHDFAQEVDDAIWASTSSEED